MFLNFGEAFTYSKYNIKRDLLKSWKLKLVLKTFVSLYKFYRWEQQASGHMKKSKIIPKETDSKIPRFIAIINC